MTTCIFRSPLAIRLQSFLDMRCISGRKRKSEQKILTYIDRYLMSELKPGETITYELLNRWIQDMEHLSVGTRINRICIMRQFCHYLGFFDLRTCIVHNSFLPHRTRPAPYIYSRSEVRSIMAAAKQIGPSGSLRPEVIATLIGLLYTTGIRIGEALKLTINDVDLNRRLLMIRETKFKKSRYVPLSSSATRVLATYLSKRCNAGFSPEPDAPVFVSLTGNAHWAPSISNVFLKIIRDLGLRGPKGMPGPRIHDFRHTFAVNRLAEWYRQGANLASKLPLLTTYLGHTTVTCTQVYLQATAELLEKAGEKFHSRFAVPLMMGGKEASHVKRH
jgi:integrase/recombinase XerD